MLTVALPQVAGFLRDDNAATLRLLLALRETLPPDLVARIDQAASASEPDVADGPALEERNRLLREMLAATVSSPDLTPDMRRVVTAHMTDRASRVPIRYVPTAAPATTSTAKR